MAITKPPKRQEQPGDVPAVKPKQPTESDIQAVINRGGSVPSEIKPAPQEDPLRGFELRLYQSMIDEIELSRNRVTKGKKPSRNAWIVVAIQEKLERELQLIYRQAK